MPRTQVTTRLLNRQIKGSIRNTTSSGFAATVTNVAYALTTGCFSVKVRFDVYQTSTGAAPRLLHLVGGGVIAELYRSSATQVTLAVSSTTPAFSNSVASTGILAVPLFDGNWHTVTACWSASGMKIWLDDTEIASSGTSTAPTYSANPALAVGNYGGSTYGLLGNQTEIQIGSAVPTLQQVKDVHFLGADLPSCVSRWDMGKLSGTTVTDSKGVTDLILTGATKVPDSPIRRKLVERSFPYSLRYRKVDGTYISIPYNNIGASISMSVWFKSNFTDTSNQSLLSIMSCYLFATKTTLQFYPNVYAGAETFAYNFVNGQKYNIVVTQTGTSLIFYVNGDQVATITAANAINTADFSNYIGKYSTVYTDSEISAVAIWSRVLTEAEVAELYFENKVSTTNLENWYKINEGSGTSIADSSGNGRTGTMAGGFWIPGFFTRRLSIRNFAASMKFVKGSSTRSSLPYVNIGTTVTLAGWFKPNWVAGENQDTWVYGDSLLRCTNAGMTFYTDGSVGTNVTASYNFINGNVYHVAVTVSGTTVSFYVNGFLVRTATAGAGIDVTSVSSQIGYYGLAANPFNGEIAEVTIYSTAFTAAQIAAMYYENQVPAANLEYYYKFATGSGTTATDSSGNARDGTITAGTWVPGFFANRTQIT